MERDAKEAALAALAEAQAEAEQTRCEAARLLEQLSRRTSHEEGRPHSPPAAHATIVHQGGAGGTASSVGVITSGGAGTAKEAASRRASSWHSHRVWQQDAPRGR